MRSSRRPSKKPVVTGSRIRQNPVERTAPPNRRVNVFGKAEYAVADDVTRTANFMDGQAQFALGINNILDEDPPPCRSCDLNSFDGTLYPVPGPFVHAAIKF